jgi:tRNA-modifying protein YgfZ
MADGSAPVNSPRLFCPERVARLLLGCHGAMLALRAPMIPSIEDQVRAARSAVLAVPDPDLVAMQVTGADRVSWLNGLLTCDLATAKTGDAVYGLAVAQKGRILTDLIVLLEPERTIVLVRRSAAASLAEAFERHLMMEDAELTPAFDDFSVVALHGPRSAAVLARVLGAGASGGLVDLTGLGGAVVAWRKESDAAVREALRTALAVEGGVSGDVSGWRTLRLERAVPSFGADFDATTYPQEAGLETKAVSFSKGCYLGQEVVCMLQMRGHVKRKLVALVLDGDKAPSQGAHVFDNDGDTDVGQVTSADVSPTLGKPVALAMIKHALAVPGQMLAVEGQSARVVELPA